MCYVGGGGIWEGPSGERRVNQGPGEKNRGKTPPKKRRHTKEKESEKLPSWSCEARNRPCRMLARVRRRRRGTGARRRDRRGRGRRRLLRRRRLRVLMPFFFVVDRERGTCSRPAGLRNFVLGVGDGGDDDGFQLLGWELFFLESCGKERERGLR